MRKSFICLLSILLLCLSGCGKKIKVENLDDSSCYPLNTDNIYTNSETNGYYFTQNIAGLDYLYYLDNDQSETIKLSGMSYTDDKPLDQNRTEMKKYGLSYDQGTFLNYGKYCYSLYEKITVEKKVSVMFSRVNMTANTREDLYEFKKEAPISYFIHKGNVYFIYLQTDENGLNVARIEGFNDGFKIVLPYSISSCIPSGDYLYYCYSDDTGTINTIARLNLNDGKYEDLAEGLVLAVNGNYLAYRKLDHIVTDISDLENIEAYSYLMDLTTKETKLTYTNEFIFCLRDDYFITYKTKGTQECRKYDYQGKQLASIIPSDFNQDVYPDPKAQGAIGGDLDYSFILASNQDSVIVSTGEHELTYLRCDFTKHTCEILNFN